MISNDRSKADRLLIVGWDGADWDILDPLMQGGYMPTLLGMTRDGLRGDLASTIPSHSWAAWSSFLTGVNPGRHGVYDFVEVHPNEPQRRIPISSDSIKAPTFFEHLSAAGQEVRIGNVPVTFPPFPVRGRLISGVAIPPGAEFAYPPEWGHDLERRAPFPVNGMEWTAFRERPAALVGEARDLEARRTDSFLMMLEGDWSVATCVYVAPDRLQHPFARYLIQGHPDYQRLVDTPLAESLRVAYRALDLHLEQLRAAAGPNATTDRYVRSWLPSRHASGQSQCLAGRAWFPVDDPRCRSEDRALEVVIGAYARADEAGPPREAPDEGTVCRRLAPHRRVPIGDRLRRVGQPVGS